MEETGHYVDALSPSNLQELPIGVKKRIGNLTYTVAFVKAKLNPQHAALTAFAKIEIPQQNTQTGKPFSLFFGAEDIKFSYNGGLVGDARLVLLDNVAIPFNGNKWELDLKGGFDAATGTFADLTYVKIDCEGFKELGVSADVAFSRDVVIPLNAQMDIIPDPTQRVKGAFHTIVKDWNDMLVEVSLSPFALKAQPKFAFTVNQAVFDFSDLRNSPSVVFPQKYTTELLDPANMNLWRGVFVQSLQVVLPPEFKQRGSNNRISFGAHNLLIDNFGVSGDFSANNILALNNGDASGWAFSVDTFALKVEVNQLKAGRFAGNLKLPVSEKTDLHYTAAITPTDYLIAVANNKPLDFSLWRATLHLDRGSTVLMAVQNSQFRPKAILNGYMSLSMSSDTAAVRDTLNDKSRIPKLTFQALTLQTEQPYFQVQAMGYAGQVKLQNFPISLNGISVAAVGDDVSLKLGIAVNLMSGNSAFGASGDVAIVGKIENNGRQRWKYDHVALSALAVNADFGAFAIKGGLQILKKDPVYGDGFNAHVELDLKKGFKLHAQANAIFGSTTYRYWMVDGLVDGLNIQAGPITLTGFGGGASNRMKRNATAPVMGGVGLTYTPDQSTGFAFKAAVFFAVGAKDLVKGNLAFEIVFNSSGGLNKMGLYGDAKVLASRAEGMAGLDKLQAKLKQAATAEESFANQYGQGALNALGYSDKAKQFTALPPSNDQTNGIEAKMGIEYDFQNNVLHSTSEMYVSLVGGVLRGRGPNNRAGWSVLHIEPGSWYMQIGTPQDRLGLRLGIASLNVEAGGYFMMGDNMPPSPPPPPIVASILGVDAQELNYTRDLSALSGGRGVAFGADFSVDTGDLSFLIFYASFQAGAGFDIMLRDYGTAQCSGGNGPIGINGWYANGQSYAYMQGELGLHIKLFFINKKIPIIKGAAAVLLQARAPNPSWFRGYLGGSYNLLGGLVQGSFRLKVELGQKCEIVNAGPAAGLAVISDITPKEGNTGVDVFAAPQAAFNMKVERNFRMEDDEGIKTYFIKLNKFEVVKSGQAVEGTLEWNSNHDVATFHSFEILPPQASLTARVKVAFYEVKDGEQVPVYVNGAIATEEKAVSFTTGTAPTTIPFQNIAHCYPVIDQQNFYTAERSTGWVQLKQGQSYLFDNANTYSGSFVSATDSLTVPVTYQQSARRIAFTMPQLAQDRAYRFLIKATPVTASQSTVSETTTQANIGGDANNTLAVKSKTLNGTASNGGAAAKLLTYDLRTSQYPTFSAKLQSITVANNNISKPTGTSDIVLLGATTTANEPFDVAELVGNTYSSGPLAFITAVPDDSYYRTDIQPLIYQHYGLGGIVITARDTALLGAPPLRAVPVSNAYKVYAEQGINELFRKTTFPYGYELAALYKQDYRELQYKVVNATLGTGTMATYYNLIMNPFPLMTRGNYKIKLLYRFPDGTSGSSGIFQYYCPIN
ncbi:hypothetical protein IC235_15055 [Hymenobacter sp. BT664]|uniref:Uncharacterized protein n=1 Tax=Hymenobacter montanus TaxID=2771359 RepID=A0A927GKI8_9BACT|nr:hypothetical protein [Hymenobacter montanus]MBD2769209.1 hypothetical protein [Hymenobacter montanus]